MRAWAACHRMAAGIGSTQAVKECEDSALESLLQTIDGGINWSHMMALTEQRTLATFGGYEQVMSALGTWRVVQRVAPQPRGCPIDPFGGRPSVQCLVGAAAT